MTQAYKPAIDAVKLDNPIVVGGVKLGNRAFLAPMSGITDLPFRKLAWKYGAGLVVSEMVASEAFLTGQAEMTLKAASGNLPLHMVQIAGCEPKWMAKAAAVVETSGAQIIDINMGCPAKRVINGQSGSALMRDLNHAMTLIDAVVKAVKIPVTLKMRLGWDHNSLNADELATRAEDAGVQMITVHGRTRCQFYKGNADWEAVARVRAKTGLPVVVNGDILDPQSANLATAVSGSDAVMVGRGAYGAPWMPAHIAGRLTTPDIRALECNFDEVRTHYEDIVSFYGKHLGVRQARKHIGWYLDRLNLPEAASPLRKSILTSENTDAVVAGLKELFKMHTPVAGSLCAA